MNSEPQLNNVKTLGIEDKTPNHPDFIEQEEKRIITAKYHYYRWLSRMFIMFAVLSLLLFLSASLSLFNLAPQVTVEPFLIIKQDTSDGIVRYEPIAKDMASKKQLMELFVKQYVILRNTIIRDEREMMLRWYHGGMINFLSSEYVFSKFDEYREEMWPLIIKSKMVREVEIISINKLGGENSPIWKVDFITYDLSDGSNDKTKGMTLSVGYWTASVTAFFFPERQFVGLRLINPLGFTVTRYSQTEVSF